MWDKLDLRIPFDDLHVSEMRCAKSGQRRGMVDISLYDFPSHAEVVFVDGNAQITSAPQAQKWGTISSGISSLAIGFFPNGNGFYEWPHVCLKASPTKILQGHNVFGSENIRPGAIQMLANLKLAFPKIASHLNFQLAEIRYLDSTYSAFVDSKYKRDQIISLFEKLFPNKNAISRYVGYLQANKDSEYHRQKVYYKHQELEADAKKARKSGDKERYKILVDVELQAFAYGRMRFEGTTGHRALENLGIPTNLHSFLKFHDWFKKTHKQSLCQYLWHKCFDKVFDQLKGHTMKNVDDNEIKLKIDAKYTKIKDDGKICKRKANAIWRVYRQIKTEGYDQLASEDNATFFRNVKHLVDAGISRAFLKSLDPNKPNENVIAFVNIIDIDFSKQKPDWYQEPKEGFGDYRPHLRLVS